MTIKKLTILATALTAAATASAVPAMRGLRPVTLPDGTTMMVERVGDERRSFTLNADGALLRWNGDTYRLADLAADGSLTDSPVPVRWDSPAVQARIAALETSATGSPMRVASGVGTLPDRNFPRLGQQKALVLLVQYQDVKFTLDDPYTYFHDMLNKEGFSDPVYGGTGSCRDFFIESSGGRFVPQFDVFGPVTLPNDRAFYGTNGANGGIDPKAPYMAVHACQQLDSQVDFSQYDRDGDGIIDNVFIFYAGPGEATYGPETSVWPHAGAVSPNSIGVYNFDGKRLLYYGCSNEWEYDRPDGIGTFCHEFSHVLGLPDLYATSAQSAYTPGTWTVMDYGPYNNIGRTPPTHSSFERNALGWIDLVELTADTESVTLTDLRTTNSAYSITNPRNANEFYLFENRQQEGTDTYLPGHGMLVWHVLINSERWRNNTINDNDEMQYVDLIEADGKAAKTRRSASDAFPGTTMQSRLSPKWWSTKHGYTALRLLDITENSADGTVSFRVANAPTRPETGEPWNVDCAIAFASDGDVDDVTVTGHVVGYCRSSSYGVNSAVFKGGSITGNVLLADSPDENNWSNCIPVQLASGSDARAMLNLKDNPEILGAKVSITGKLGSYLSARAMRDITDVKIDKEESSIGSIVADGGDDAPAHWFDLSGRRVSDPSAPGVYISTRGEKIIL